MVGAFSGFIITVQCEQAATLAFELQFKANLGDADDEFAFLATLGNAVAHLAGWPSVYGLVKLCQLAADADAAVGAKDRH